MMMMADDNEGGKEGQKKDGQEQDRIRDHLLETLESPLDLCSGRDIVFDFINERCGRDAPWIGRLAGCIASTERYHLAVTPLWKSDP